MGNPCHDFYDYVCINLEDRLRPPPGVASSADTQLANNLEDALLGYLNVPTHKDVRVGRELLAECGRAKASDIAEMLRDYIPQGWPLPVGQTLPAEATWQAAGYALRDLGIAVLLSLAPHPGTVAYIGPPDLLYMRGDTDITDLDRAVRDATKFLSSDTLGVADEVTEVVRRLLVVADSKLPSPSWLPTPLTNLPAGTRTLVRASKPLAADAQLLPGLNLTALDALVQEKPAQTLQYVGFRVALWSVPFVESPPDSLIKSFMLNLRPPLAEKSRLCVRALGMIVPLTFLRALRGALGPMTLARAWTEQLEDRFLRALPAILGDRNG